MSMNEYWDTAVFPLLTDNATKDTHTLSNDWPQMISGSLVFCGYDPKVFGELIIIVKEHRKRKEISTASITRFGTSYYPNLMVDARSRFWPACENLLPQDQKIPIRRALAITALKNYSKLINKNNLVDDEVSSHPWDETDAGNIASDMKQMTDSSSLDFGKFFIERGVLQNQSIPSYMVDVLYDNQSVSQPHAAEQNNKLIATLGEQLDQIFDPLLEYSPEEVDIAYSPPSINDFRYPYGYNHPSIVSVIDELLEIQQNFSLRLVRLLQDLIIPLRIHVLSAAAEIGIQKINRVFPPTIDEVTRINCILQDSLQKAAPFGYVEIIKVLGTTIPYFYKASIRHEANMKNFLQRFNKFYEKNREVVFENRIINKGGYTLREVDAIVSGSLVQLPRLKLLIKRLHGVVIDERTKSLNFETDSSNEMVQIEYYLENALRVIDAFGLQEDNSLKVDISQRIFTPTGKMLTELASEWPAELQYGWLSRKVVGIFELKNVEPTNPSYFIDVLVIFSDKILVLTVTDETYYDDSNPRKHMRVSDILLHSLVNGKPLPEHASIASMRVSSWCDINKIHTSYYSIVHGKETRNFLQLTGLDNENFGNNAEKENSRIFNFELFHHTSTVQEITDLINKSKILYKNQPFHLFRSCGKSRAYLTAHEVNAYRQERCRSPIALALNTNLEDMETLFLNFSNITLLFHLYFTDSKNENVVVGMYLKDSNVHIMEEVHIDNLPNTLYELIGANFLQVMNYSLLRVCQSKLANLVTSYRSLFLDDEIFKYIREEGDKRHRETKESETKLNSRKEQPPFTEKALVTNKQDPQRKISFFSRLFGRLNKGKLSKWGDKRLSEPTEMRNEPQGVKVEYKHLLVPSPTLHKLDGSKTSILDKARQEPVASPTVEQEEEWRHEVTRDEPAREAGSYDMNSTFRFPHHTPSSEHTTFILDKDSIFDAPQRSKTKTSLPASDSKEKIDQLKDDPHFAEFLRTYLYKDGENNWTTITKWELGQLNKEISTLKQLTTMDSQDVIEIESRDSSYSDSSLREAITEKYEDVLSDLPTKRFTPAKAAIGRDSSIQSITPSIAAYELGKAMDFNFSSQSLGNNSSGDEYFSTEENIQTKIQHDQRTPDSACFSDDTIVIDSIPTKILEAEAILSNEKQQAMRSGNSMTRDPSFYLGNFESMAYLSRLMSNS